MRRIVIMALFLVLVAGGCGGYGDKGKSPGGGTTTNSGTPGY